MAFCHSQRDLVINMVKKLMDNATKTGINATKTAFKRVIQKTVEATGYLTETKIAEKITSRDKQTKILTNATSKMKDKNFVYYQKKDSKLQMFKIVKGIV